MGYFEHRSEIDIAIASCYDQIEVLKNKIRLLEEQKAKEEHMNKLIQAGNQKDSE